MMETLRIGGARALLCRSAAPKAGVLFVPGTIFL